MAPREQRVLTSSPALLKGDQAEKLLETLRKDAARVPYKPPAPAASRPPPVAAPPSPAEMQDVKPRTQAEVLRAAAKKGAAFCEVCEQEDKKDRESAGR